MASLERICAYCTLDCVFPPVRPEDTTQPQERPAPEPEPTLVEDEQLSPVRRLQDLYSTDITYIHHGAALRQHASI